MKRYDRALVWFRRDLRADDHAALSHALAEARAVYCAFVFDTEILDPLTRKADRRVEFIWRSLLELRKDLNLLGGDLHVLYGRARDRILAFAHSHEIQAVYINHDYEPLAISRDRDVARRLGAEQRALHTFKDQVIFEKSEILNAEQRPYVVFTPYKKAWLAKLGECDTKPYPVASRAEALASGESGPIPALESIGFSRTNLSELNITAGTAGARSLFETFMRRIGAYAERRNFPAEAGPSLLSVHLRFGTISIRELVRSVIAVEADADASDGASAWLSELIWREFYFSILHHFPHVAQGAFKREYEALAFDNRESHFRNWCNAATGYPLVDAAMRQLNATGYMHNRLRMVSASFLVKDLLVDWRRGERYFAQHLIDFDLAANNGGWQWAASTGCDAQPYFRIFNPVTQSQKFDPDGKFIRRYLPELAGCSDRYIHAPWLMNVTEQQKAHVVIGRDYPAPIVDHATQRKRALELYGRATRAK